MSLLGRLLNWLRRPPSEGQFSMPGSDQIKTYITTMVNTVTLSTDMKTLYIIDNGRALSFDLENKYGVVLGTIGGQITAATALAEAPVADPDDQSTDSGEATAARAALSRTTRLFLQNRQYTTLFIKEKVIFSVVGATDIDFGLTASADDGIKCNINNFPLETTSLRIRRLKEYLEITQLGVK